jgi:hypothetical protein
MQHIELWLGDDDQLVLDTTPPITPPLHETAHKPVLPTPSPIPVDFGEMAQMAVDGTRSGQAKILAQRVRGAVSDRVRALGQTEVSEATKAREWYYSKNATQNGPVSLEELKKLAQTGALLATDLLWSEGFADWRPASAAKGLNFLQPKPVAPPPDETKELADDDRHEPDIGILGPIIDIVMQDKPVEARSAAKQKVLQMGLRTIYGGFGVLLLMVVLIVIGVNSSRSSKGSLRYNMGHAAGVSAASSHDPRSGRSIGMGLGLVGQDLKEFCEGYENGQADALMER